MKHTEKVRSGKSLPGGQGGIVATSIYSYYLDGSKAQVLGCSCNFISNIKILGRCSLVCRTQNSQGHLDIWWQTDNKYIYLICKEKLKGQLL